MTPNGETRDRAEQLFQRFGPMVYRRACTILGDPDEAKDVSQEVFITLLRVASEIESEASTWLYRVTTNACLNRLRAKRRYDAMRARSERAVISAGRNAEAEVLVRRLLAEGDPTCSAAAVYVYVEGMSHEEAAEVLGVSRRTVGNLLDRFVSWAHDQLRDLGDLTATRTEVELPDFATSGVLVTTRPSTPASAPTRPVTSQGTRDETCKEEIL